MSKENLPLESTETSPLPSPRQGSGEPTLIVNAHTVETLFRPVIQRIEECFGKFGGNPADTPTSQAQKTMGNMLTDQQKQFQISMILTLAGTIIGLFALIIPILMSSIDSKVSGLEAKMEAGQVETREQFKTLSNQLEEMDRRYTIRQEYYEKVIDERTKK